MASVELAKTEPMGLVRLLVWALGDDSRGPVEAGERVAQRLRRGEPGVRHPDVPRAGSATGTCEKFHGDARSRKPEDADGVALQTGADRELRLKAMMPPSVARPATTTPPITQGQRA